MSAATPNPFTPAKRVVTGHNDNGQSTIIFDDSTPLAPIRAGIKSRIGRSWVTAETPANNDDSKTDMSLLVAPGREGILQPNGSVASILELAPHSGSPMHRTTSIDYWVLIYGEHTLILEDGSEQTLSEPGSIVVQRGTMHKWENRTDSWVRAVAIQIGAKPVEVKDAEGNVKSLVEEWLPSSTPRFS